MKRLPQIEVDTPLRAQAVAQSVWEEASLWLDERLPRRWIGELIAQADAIYACNPRFRRRLRGAGNRGRDWLWVFTRHWLAALMREQRPGLHARLPPSYNTGHALPPKPGERTPSRNKRRSSPLLPPIRTLDAELAWANAAKFY